MTSGNLTDEPICYEDADARTRLEHIADAWLLHDRPIHVPCDDSVVRMGDRDVLPIRRSRGYAPLPVRLPFEAAPVLAMGGELKNTFCLATGRQAWVSQHIGDMGSLETLCAFERSTRQFRDMYAVDPECIVADAHPGYQTRRWAEEQNACAVSLVQHHHAHIAAVMVEHGVPADERVIGFAFDGTGYGTDGTIWGGEALIAGYDGFERPVHLRNVPLPGGDATVRRPYRAALAHLWAAGIAWSPDLPPVRHATKNERETVHHQLQRSVLCIPSSSMGRLFDAVSSLLGVRHEASYEAQAAMELEWAAGAHLDDARPYRFAVAGGEIDPAPVLRALVDDMRAGCPVGPMAAGFHVAVADVIAEVAVALRTQTGILRVALSGGVFQNVLLLRLAGARLAARGLQVLTHRLVPPNDGGLALGQAALAGRAAGEGADLMTRLEAHPQGLDRPAAELAAAALTLARSFAAGATMWCVAPEWPSHARHVAVEFVHPVIVGKKALPARNVEGAEAERALRLLARPRDVLLLVGTDGVRTDQLLSRAEAWGLTRIWLGLGRRPATSRADHLVWSETDNPDLTAHSGDMVVLYHLLWELTHVVFEHPGLLAAEQ